MRKILPYRSPGYTSLTPAITAAAPPAETDTETIVLPEEEIDESLDQPWHVIVYDDPVNLMSYVTMVIQRVFGYPSGTAERMMLATAFARPFSYYDGVFFEVVSAALGAEAPVAAGGRYDGLPARLGSPRATGAVGCMVRPDRAFGGAS